MRRVRRLVEWFRGAALPGCTQLVGIEKIRLAGQCGLEREFRQGILSELIARGKHAEEVDVGRPAILVQLHHARCDGLIGSFQRRPIGRDDH